ncbi:MAG: hypothetical protein ACOX17_03530 [Christensenellales bacterium]|jgi:hypothetical protein
MNHMNFKRRLAALLSMILTFICVVSVTSPVAHAESMAEPENYVEMLTRKGR